MCASLGPTSLGLSELTGLPGRLFPLPDWGSFLSLFFQISFQCLALPLLLLASLWFGCWHISRCPRVFLYYPCFFEFLFLLSVLVECLFFPYVLNHWFESWIPSLHCWFPVDFTFISLSVTFISSLCCCCPQWVLWVSWSPIFWVLHLIGLLSPFHLVLFLGFCSILSFGPYFFLSSIWHPPCVCLFLYVR